MHILNSVIKFVLQEEYGFQQKDTDLHSTTNNKSCWSVQELKRYDNNIKANLMQCCISRELQYFEINLSIVPSIFITAAWVINR